MSEEPQRPEAPSPVEPSPPEAPPATPTPPEVPPPRRRAALVAALPFLATAIVAIALSLLFQYLLVSPGQSAAPSIIPAAAIASAEPATAPPATAVISASATAAATSAPAPTAPRGDEGVLSLQILDLQEQNRQLWSAIYLLRAADQTADAVSALVENDLDEADRTLLTVYRSLEQAYVFSAEQEKGPIDTFRLEVSAIRDDIRVRPDAADQRLRQLRQLILSLVDEGG